MTADYRTFIRIAENFDGVTVEAAVYTTLGFLQTTTTVSSVGIFTPAALKRLNGCVSLVKPAFDVVNPGDVVRVVTQGGAIRQELPASLTGEWMFLYPNDRFVVLAPRAQVLNLLVNDLTDDQLNASLSAVIVAAASATSSTNQQQTLVITSLAATITPAPPASPGPVHVVVFVDAPVSGDLTLPPPEVLSLDSRVTVIKSGAANVNLVCDDPTTDAVNGSTDADGPTSYVLRTLNDNVTYTRVEGGWQRPQGTGTRSLQVATASPFDILPSFEGVTFVSSELAVAGDDLRLPDVGEIRTGHTVVGRNTQAVAIDLVGVGTSINSAATVVIPALTTFAAFYNGVEWTLLLSN